MPIKRAVTLKCSKKTAPPTTSLHTQSDGDPSYPPILGSASSFPTWCAVTPGHPREEAELRSTIEEGLNGLKGSEKCNSN